MKLTTKLLKKLIKEELQNSLHEEEINEGDEISDEEVKAGEAFAKSPMAKQVFAKLDNDPKVQQALQKAMGNLQEADDDMDAGATATGMMLGMGVAGSPTGVVKMGLAGAAGKALLGTVGLALGVTGAGAAMILTPMAIGYLIDKMRHKSKQAADAKKPKIAFDPKTGRHYKVPSEK